MNVVWLPEANEDIQRLYDFLLKRDPKAAEMAVRAIRDGSQELLDYPKVGRPMDDETGRRELLVPLGAGAYVLRYIVLDDRVVVIRVWHSREKRV